MRSQNLDMIELLKNDKDEKTTLDAIQVVVNSLSTQVAKLEKELVSNRNLASLITIQIRAIFAKERAKFEVAPEPLPAALALPNNLKTRSVNVATSSAGSGNNYEHPLKVNYDNPIETIHYAGGDRWSHMLFCTRDGDLGKQQQPVVSLPCIVNQKPGSEVRKIQVWHDGYIYGIRFLDLAGDCVL